MALKRDGKDVMRSVGSQSWNRIFWAKRTSTTAIIINISEMYTNNAQINSLWWMHLVEPNVGLASSREILTWARCRRIKFKKAFRYNFSVLNCSCWCIFCPIWYLEEMYPETRCDLWIIKIKIWLLPYITQIYWKLLNSRGNRSWSCYWKVPFASVGIRWLWFWKGRGHLHGSTRLWNQHCLCSVA